MTQFTTKEMDKILDESFELGFWHEDSIEQFKRDRAGSRLRNTIEAVKTMDMFLEEFDNDYEAAWNSFRSSLMFDVNYYYNQAKMLQRSADNGS